MKITLRRSALTALLAAAALGFSDPNDFAVAVKNFSPGPFGATTADSALGGPEGAGNGGGSFSVATLGVGGTLTLQFGNRCFDGIGADLLVCENPFLVSTGGSFAETMFVEVSSNGTDFARFPNRYLGPNNQLPPIQGAPLAWYRGLAGVRPVVANVVTGHDPLDVVHAGGDAFDLGDLAGDQLVQSGVVDTSAILYVRLVDVDSGNAQDSTGTTIWDCGLDSQSSADVDAIVALNSDGNEPASRPHVELALDAQGFLSIEVTDLDGWKDVKNGLAAALDGTEFPFGTLLSVCAVRSRTLPMLVAMMGLPADIASISELLAKRLAPCRPVRLTSPQAQRPSTLLRPSISTAMPPMW